MSRPIIEAQLQPRPSGECDLVVTISHMGHHWTAGPVLLDRADPEGDADRQVRALVRTFTMAAG